MQVIDADSLKIIRSLPDLIPYSLVISFDGRRMYVGTDPFIAISTEHRLQERSDLIDVVCDHRGAAERYQGVRCGLWR